MKVSGWRMTSVAALGLSLCLGSELAHGACLDLAQDNRQTFEGSLYFQVFGGPPYNGGVSKGDTPEPTFILKLDAPVCVAGDEFLDANEKVDKVQIFSSDDNAAEFFKSLRRLAGRRVRVEGKSAFTAHTGHHHAPLLLPIAKIIETSDPAEADGGGMAVVQAFYLALAEGHGEVAARFVVPEKRASGPLSARAMTSFYGQLDELLAFMEVKRTGADEFKVRYSFVSRGNQRCDGAAMVHIVAVNGENLIGAIKALNGC